MSDMIGIAEVHILKVLARLRGGRERERRLRMMLQASHNLATFIEQMKLCADEEI